jgi:glyoxylase-like metal-dependent hydrolase (beta-lactamase superfamily II)
VGEQQRASRSEGTGGRRRPSEDEAAATQPHADGEQQPAGDQLADADQQPGPGRQAAGEQRPGGEQPVGGDQRTDGGSVPPPVTRFEDGVIAIDTLTGGLTSVTAGYLLPAARPTLIECGPALTVEAVLQALDALGLGPQDLAYLVVTHIHLDHAGGAGDVAAAFPDATVIVSDLGARHLHDPEKLNASSRRVYGPLFDTVYGPCTPIEAGRVHGVTDGDTLDLGGGRRLELLHTPGHAKHHIGVFDPTIGAVFTGDSIGVKLPGMHRIRPATPPADFHLEASLDSISRYRERSPERLYLAHYGPIDEPDDALAEAADQLRAWTDVAEEAYREALSAGGGADHELQHVAETLQQRFATELDPGLEDEESIQRVELLNDTRSNAAGLLRYLQRRDAGTLTPLG